MSIIFLYRWMMMNQSMHSNLVLLPRQRRIIRLAIIQKILGWMQCRWIHYIAFWVLYTQCYANYVCYTWFVFYSSFHFIRQTQNWLPHLFIEWWGDLFCLWQKISEFDAITNSLWFLHAQKWLRKISIFNLSNSPVRSISNCKVQPSIWLW